MTDLAALRAAAAARFVDVWPDRADVTRPDGVPTFDAGTGTYSDAVSTVATGMACSLTATTVPDTPDVAGDPAVQLGYELEYDPQYVLQVDDRVVFTSHPDSGIAGTTLYVVGVGQAYQHVYGVAYLQRTAADSGS